jgi:hypothetical protein
MSQPPALQLLLQQLPLMPLPPLQQQLVVLAWVQLLLVLGSMHVSRDTARAKAASGLAQLSQQQAMQQRPQHQRLLQETMVVM